MTYSQVWVSQFQTQDNNAKLNICLIVKHPTDS